MRQRFKPITLALLLLLPSLTAMAQGKVSDVLARAEQALLGQRATEASFTSTQYNAQGKPLGSLEGKLIQQGESFRLEYGSMIAVYSQKTLAVYDAEEETLTYSNPSADELLQINPLHFLQSRGKGFDSRIVSQSANQTSVRFTPKTKGNIKDIVMHFSHQTKLPEVVTLTANDGSTIGIKASNVRSTAARKASDFVLEAKQYAHCELIDLR